MAHQRALERPLQRGLQHSLDGGLEGNGPAGPAISTQLLFIDDFVNSPLNADYVQSWRGTASGTGSSVGPLSTGIEGHPGIARLATGTTTLGAATMHHSSTSGGNNRSLLPSATNAITIDAVIRVSAVPDATNNFVATIGSGTLLTLLDNTFAAQIVWTGSAVRWRLMTQISGGALTTVDATTGPAADTWYHVQLVFTTALVTLNIDGTEVATSSTDVPTGGGSPLIRMQKSAGTVIRYLDVDFFQITQTVAARLS